jgi:type VI secretion system protein ImpK
MPTGGDDPFRPSNATVLRPKPGAGKRTPAAPPPIPPSPSPVRRPPPAYAAPGAPVGEPAVRPAPGGEGLNPLVTAAVPLLLMVGGMRGSTIQGDVPALRRQALEEIRRFEENARIAGIANEVIIAGRYALCAALDEAVLATPWGAHSDWAQNTLLNTLHREAYGGEKFFEMLERIAQDPVHRIDLIELQYLCIALGFTGKFQLLEQGQLRLAQTQHDIFQRIRSVRSPPEQELSLHWHGVQDQRHRLVRYVPWWVALTAALAVITAAFVLFKYRLDSQANPIYAALAPIGTESAAASPAAATPTSAPVGPTLRQLLADEESSGSVHIEENGPTTRITLIAPELFGTASATLDPRYGKTLHAIGVALEKVPGRVLIEGHTDDQPLRSFAFRDNFALSRARAESVKKILSTEVRNPARLEIVAKGPSQPRYTPASAPENRVRNRRVEIIHVRE